jgi:Predicted SPOUT methyltransferase
MMLNSCMLTDFADLPTLCCDAVLPVAIPSCLLYVMLYVQTLQDSHRCSHMPLHDLEITCSCADEWQGKVEQYASVERLIVKSNPKKATSAQVQMEGEGANVRAMLRPRDFVIVLDERGKAVTSHGIAHLLAEAGALPRGLRAA